MSKQVSSTAFQMAVKVWLRLVFASLLCFVVWVSFEAMGLSFFGEVTGYEIYEVGENPHLVASHTFSEGEDRGVVIEVEENQELRYNRVMPAQTKATVGVLSSLFMLLIYGIFPYNMLWNRGSRDNNFVNLGRISQDKLFGLKVGLLATAPSALIYILLIFGKIGLMPSDVLRWHRLLNTPFIPFIDAVEAGAKTAVDLPFFSLLALIATLLFVPLICWLGYFLGYKQISVRERLIYKKKS